MKRGTLVELSKYGRNLKWLVHSYNDFAFSEYALVLNYHDVSDHIEIAFHRLIDGKVFKRTLPRRAFRKAKVSK